MRHLISHARRLRANRSKARWTRCVALAVAGTAGLCAPAHSATTIMIGGPGEQGTFPPYYELRGGGSLSFTIPQDVKWGQTVHFTMADVLSASFDAILFGRVAWNKPWESTTISFNFADFTKFEGTIVGSINDVPELAYLDATTVFKPWSNPAFAPADLRLNSGGYVLFGEDGRNFAGKLIGVPEPTGWALMLAGFGLIGAGLRRRRQSRVEALTMRRPFQSLWAAKSGSRALQGRKKPSKEP